MQVKSSNFRDLLKSHLCNRLIISACKIYHTHFRFTELRHKVPCLTLTLFCRVLGIMVLKYRESQGLCISCDKDFPFKLKE